MTSTTTATFDLTSEPWLPVQWRDGTVSDLSLMGVLERADEAITLVGEVSTQVFALTRMLLAVLHRSIGGPATREDWETLYQEGIPLTSVRAYLDRHRERFDLFHPETPYMQVAGLRTAKGESGGLERLVADVPANQQMFTTRSFRDLRLISAAEAARWVVHAHSFDASGIKSGAVGDNHARNGKGYPIGPGWSGQIGGVFVEGPTLRDTLLLNLMPLDTPGFVRTRAEFDSDLPPWERDLGVAGEDRGPAGPVDVYTWQSRRLRLIGDRTGVRGVVLCNGDRATVRNQQRHEPHTSWRRSEAQEKKLGKALVYMARTHDPSRTLWRGLPSLLPERTGGAQGSTGASTLAPAIVQWVADLDDTLGSAVLRWRAIGMSYGSQQSTVAEIVDDTLLLPLAVLSQHDVERGELARQSVFAADQAVVALGHLAVDLAVAAGGSPAGPKDRAVEVGYAAIDEPFRRWLVSLADPITLEDAQRAWHETCRSTLEQLAQELVGAAGPAAWTGRIQEDRRGQPRKINVATAESRFRYLLRQALPAAFPATTPAKG